MSYDSIYTGNGIKLIINNQLSLAQKQIKKMRRYGKIITPPIHTQKSTGKTSIIEFKIHNNIALF